MTPKISICIPTFNRADLLDVALRSVSLQTVKPYEVIVVDNASTDDTKAVVQRYKKFGVKYVRNTKNVGMVNNWNVCIEKSTGEYLTLLHNDDVIAPNWYEVMSNTVLQHPTIKFFMSSLLIINDQKKALHIYHTFSNTRIIKKTEAIKEFWTHLLPGCAPTAANLYHKEVFRTIGLFDETFKTEADVVSSFEILKHFDVCYIKQVLFAYRSHVNQGFDTEEKQKTLHEELIRKENHYRIIKRYYQKFYKSEPAQRFFVQYPVFMTLAPVTLFLAKFEFTKVVEHFKISLKLFPDLFSNPSDMLIYVEILCIFIWRLLTSQMNIYLHQDEVAWLKDI